MDGDLDEATAARVLRHLIQCRRCRRVERSLRRVVGELGELGSGHRLGDRHPDSTPGRVDVATTRRAGEGSGVDGRRRRARRRGRHGAGRVLATSSDPATPAVASRQPWADVVDAARGQTVRLWMWGGEQALNAYVDEQVVPRAAARRGDARTGPDRRHGDRGRAGRVGGRSGPAVGRVGGSPVGERRELRPGPRRRPVVAGLDRRASRTRRVLDASDPTLWTDFGVPTDGQELPWSRAAFVFAYDPARTPDPAPHLRRAGAVGTRPPGPVHVSGAARLHRLCVRPPGRAGTRRGRRVLDAARTRADAVGGTAATAIPATSRSSSDSSATARSTWR